MALHIIDEANRCLNCKKPMCQQGCPVHTPIPTVIQLFKENRLLEAGDMLFRNNPMSAVCSIVCNHEMQCAGHCIRGRKDMPVHFSSIENYISEMFLDRMEVTRPEKKDKKVAVIGCGPAGMTVAITLAQQGYPVTVFEWKGKIGGLLQYGIPEFRLPKSIRYHFPQRDTSATTPQSKKHQNLWHNLWHKNKRTPEILAISGVLVESGGLEPSTFRV